jgi:TonB-dependent SusC/RagA subfamily outer membrane receptor
MASFSPRIIPCVLFAGFASACASGNSAPPIDFMKPEPSGAPTFTQPGTTVTGDDIDRTGAGEDAIERTLAAHVPGLVVTRTQDGGVAVRVRGNSSINGGGEPLYVIDGVEIQAGPGGALRGIDPHDIASIEVLKDAASLTYYGLRGGNGVILIKTKHN